MLKQGGRINLKFDVTAATFGWLCVETFEYLLDGTIRQAATFGWLCVETHLSSLITNGLMQQPPSGGCVLKLSRSEMYRCGGIAATFGWLCVETFNPILFIARASAATFGWLCVETFNVVTVTGNHASSHLRVAVC